MILNGDCLEVLKTLDSNSIDALVTDPPAGISFMGKAWDGDKGGRDAWIAWMRSAMSECLRVMKPGAHGLVWALPRTSHWTAMALEDAGFEIRDSIYHLFGQGFPKSLNVGLAIDKMNGQPTRGRKVLRTEGQMNEMPDRDYSVKGVAYQPKTHAAKEWAGWGTALKPACEVWWLVRKPISEKTVAANVLKWGTGGLNIDGCRIGSGGHSGGATGASKSVAFGEHTDYVPGPHRVYEQGRFPSHLILDEVAAEQLDLMSVPVKTSRFFYCAKISSIERNAGLEGMPDKRVGFSDGARRAIDRGESSYETETGGGANRIKITKNTHPTVKPQKLMRYLCKLITPPNGLILDPFTGSGSTGVAAVSEGFRFIGIEREPEYTQIAEKRVYHALPKFKKMRKA